MKQMKVFGIVSVLLMTVSLSSCVKTGDDDDWDKKWEEYCLCNTCEMSRRRMMKKSRKTRWMLHGCSTTTAR